MYVFPACKPRHKILQHSQYMQIGRLVPQWVSFFSPSLSPTWTAIQITGCPPFYFTNGVAGVTSRCSWTFFAWNAAGAELKNLQHAKMPYHAEPCTLMLPDVHPGIPNCDVLFTRVPVSFSCSQPGSYHILHPPPDCKTTNGLSEREKPSLGWIGFSCTWLTFSGDLRHQTKP